MVNISKEELAKMSKSKFGKHQASQPNPTFAFLEKYFFKTSPQRSYFNGAMTFGVLTYWWATKEFWPVLIWFAFTSVMSVLGIIYWNAEKKRLAKEIKRCEADLSEISKEIAERKEYFNEVRKKLSSDN